MEYKFKSYKKREILTGHLNLGGANPQGERIDVNSLYIERGGKPWMGVMGEYHFVRDNSENWYKELCKMKAGGVGIVSTYLFWIYHEEAEGEFDFTGDRDIRRFILEAQRAGLDAVIRIGPWVHGECRNGGFPDWLLKKPYKLRDNDPQYMEKVKIWYENIFRQVEGLFYKDGGNIVAIQVENELVDNAEHLAALKKLAQDIGYDAPIWTVTGWNSQYGARIPVDEVLPVFGAYEDAPWESNTNKLPLSPHYAFNTSRNDSAIGLDLIKKTDKDGWLLPYDRYPFATCELGGGLPTTHHRRAYIRPMDVYAMSLVKLGSGNNLIGYYMYKGGVNKIGKFSTLNETKATGYPNDYAALSYDFQAPISAYGEIREHYRLTNMLHMFANDFGAELAAMETVMAEREVDQNNLSDLRYAMRTNGKSGFVFVNHYQRLAELKDIEGAVINTGPVVFPPIDVRGNVSFIMPFNMRLSGILLEYATAQPLCRMGDTYFFAAIEGIAPRFKLAGKEAFSVTPGISCVSYIRDIKIVTLTWDEARYARKINDILYVGESCDIYCGDAVSSAEGGSFSYYRWTENGFREHAVRCKFKQAEISFIETPAPFKPTAEYELEIGGKRRLKWYRAEVTTADGFVEIPFECDVAQLYVDGELKADNFYYGTAWRVPAALMYGREAYVVISEIRNDFYREI